MRHLDPSAAAAAVEQFPIVGDGSGLSTDGRYYREEVQFALRNHGMPLEALAYPITPTGMHYLVVHWDVPHTSAEDWVLDVGGLVARPLRLSLDDLQKRPAVTLPVTMECAGNGRSLLEPRNVSQPWFVEAIGTAEWTGTPLRGVLEDAGVTDSTREVVFTGVDWGFQGGELQPYQRSLSLEEALRDEVLVVYAMNGRPLEPQHGAPLRLVVPGWYGMANVKWLARIDCVAEPFNGYQMSGSYRIQRDPDDPGEPVTLMHPRALMIPPGVPDFATRTRVVKAGPVTLAGRAWTSRSEITRVEVSTNGGETWGDAVLKRPVSPFAWCGWSFQWHAEPGWQVLAARAWDSAGRAQPLDPDWNLLGMANTAVTLVDVLVV